MRSDNLTTLPVLLGHDRQLFGVRLAAAKPDSAVGIIFLNAGLLHNVGPFRMYVDLADRLAALGHSSLRLDQSGKGESPRRLGVSPVDSLTMDYDEAFASLEAVGVRSTILLGLCSGADDALLIADQRDSVSGLVLLDGWAPRTSGYYLRHYGPRVLRFQSWLGAFRRVTERGNQIGGISLRRWDSKQQMAERFGRILSRGSRVLSVFTGEQHYYNYVGQLGDCVKRYGSVDQLEEFYFREADHTYSVEQDRRTLYDKIETWIAG